MTDKNEIRARLSAIVNRQFGGVNTALDLTDDTLGYWRTMHGIEERRNVVLRNRNYKLRRSKFNRLRLWVKGKIRR